MKLVGGGKRSIVIQFVADTVKAARDIDNLTKKMDRARTVAGTPSTSTRRVIGTTAAGFLPTMTSGTRTASRTIANTLAAELLPTMASVIRQKRKTFHGMFDNMDSWDRGWYKRKAPGLKDVSTGRRGREGELDYVVRSGQKIPWQQDLVSRTRGPIQNIDRNLDFLTKRRRELGLRPPEKAKYTQGDWGRYLFGGGGSRRFAEMVGARDKYRRGDWSQWLYGGGGTKKFGEMAGARLSGLSNAAEGASGSIMGMIGKFGKMAGVIGLVVLGLTMMAKALNAILGPIFHHGNIIEGNLIQMEVLLGNAHRANAMMREAIRFSVLTPFTPEETFGAVTASLQYNIDPFKKGAYGLGQNQNVMQILSGLGSFRDIQGNALGVERAAHAVMRGDYRLLRPYRGIVQPAFETAKKAGHVGTPAFTQKFIEELGKIPQIMAMAERHSNSMAGMWSTIKGFAEEFWIAVSGAGEMQGVVTFWSQLKDIVKDIRDGGLQFLDYIRPGLVEFGAMIGSIFKFIWDMAKAAWNFLNATGMLTAFFKIIWQLLRAIFSIVTGVLRTASQLVSLFVDLFMVLFRSFDRVFHFSDFLGGLVKYVTQFVTGIQIMFHMLGIFIRGISREIVQAFERMIQAMKNWILDAKVFGKTIREWLNLFKSFRSESAVRAAASQIAAYEEALQTAQRQRTQLLDAGARPNSPVLIRTNEYIAMYERRLAQYRAALQIAERESGVTREQIAASDREAAQRAQQERGDAQTRTISRALATYKAFLILRKRAAEERDPSERARLQDTLRTGAANFLNLYRNITIVNNNPQKAAFQDAIRVISGFATP